MDGINGIPVPLALQTFQSYMCGINFGIEGQTTAAALVCKYSLVATDNVVTCFPQPVSSPSSWASTQTPPRLSQAAPASTWTTPRSGLADRQTHRHRQTQKQTGRQRQTQTDAGRHRQIDKAYRHRQTRTDTGCHRQT